MQIDRWWKGRKVVVARCHVPPERHMVRVSGQKTMAQYSMHSGDFWMAGLFHFRNAEKSLFLSIVVSVLQSHLKIHKTSR